MIELLRDENIRQIIYIILAWMFGLLSPLIVNKISEKREKDSLIKIIFSDLKDLKKRLASLPYLVLPKYGKLDIETFEWIRKNSDIDFASGIKKMEEKGLTVKTIVEEINQRGSKKATLSNFKKMHLFATDSHLISLSLIDANLMEKILEVRFYIEAFNEDVDDFKDYLKMTFMPGISTANHEIISAGLESRSLDISTKAKLIVDKINDILV